MKLALAVLSFAVLGCAAPDPYGKQFTTRMLMRAFSCEQRCTLVSDDCIDERTLSSGPRKAAEQCVLETRDCYAACEAEPHRQLARHGAPPMPPIADGSSF